MGEKFIMNTLKTLNTTLLLISLVSGLAGCATGGGGSSVLPRGGPSMSEIYNQQYDVDFDSGELNQVRTHVPKTSDQRGASTSNDTNRNLPSSDVPKMLPNPMISIYVYPHFDGSDQDYVPGHMAYTKLYKETHFALSGEPTQME